MNTNDTWKELCLEVTRLSFDGASPIARLVYSCEIGDITQHASEDLKEIIESTARLQARVAELETDKKGLIIWLKGMEWSSINEEGSYCADCNNYKEEGHKEDCKFSEIIKDETDTVHSDPDQCPTCDKPAYACIGHDEDPAMLQVIEKADETESESVG